MGLLDKLWDDHIGGPQPEKGLGRLREPAGLPEGFDIDQSPIAPRRSADFQQQGSDPRRITQSISIKKPTALDTTEAATSPSASSPMASSPSPSSGTPGKDNVWRSVFNPGQNKSMQKMGSDKFDNVAPNTGSPSVYDWLYHPKSKSEYR